MFILLTVKAKLLISEIQPIAGFITRHTHCSTGWDGHLFRRFCKLFFWELHRPLGYTAAAMLPKQGRGNYIKHVTKPSEQVAAPPSTQINLEKYQSQIQGKRDVKWGQTIKCVGKTLSARPKMENSIRPKNINNQLQLYHLVGNWSTPDSGYMERVFLGESLIH